MRRLVILTLLGVFFQVVLVLADDSKTIKPELADLTKSLRVNYCVQTKNPPIIDGRLDDSCWQDASLAENFILLGGGGLAKEQTKVRTLYDNSALYIAFECHELQADKIVAIRTMRNSDVWADNCIELFLDPQHMRKSASQFVVNSIGTQYDSLGNNTEWKAKATVSKDSWVAEISIPFENLGVKTPNNYDTWAVNFNRERRAGSEVELSGWSYVQSAFHEFERYGDLIFVKHLPSVMVQAIDLGLTEMTSGEKKVRVWLENRTDDIQRVTVALEINLKSKFYVEKLTAPHTVQETVLRTELLPQEATLPYNLTKGDHDLKLTVSEPDSKTPIYFLHKRVNIRQEGLISSFWPAEKYGNTFYVCQGSTQHVNVLFTRKPKHDNPFRFILEVPEGFEVLDPAERTLTKQGKKVNPLYYPLVVTHERIGRDNQPYIRYIFSFSNQIICEELEEVNLDTTFCLLINTEKMSEGRYDFFYHLEDTEGGEKEEEQTLPVVVLPRLTGRQPKEIRIGMYSWLTSEVTPDEATALLETWRQAGITEGDLGIVQPDVWRAKNLKYVAGFWWFWWTDTYLKEHPEDQAVDFDGKPGVVTGVPVICPTVLLQSESSAMKEMLNDIRKRLMGEHGMEGLIWDMEGPDSWKVCFCPRCIVEFRKFARIPEKEDLTPEVIKKEYATLWVKYACSQNAGLAKLITDAMHDVHPGSRFLVFGSDSADGRVDWSQLAKVVDASCIGYYTPNSGSATGFIRDFLKKVCTVRPDFSAGVALYSGPVLGYEHTYQFEPRILTLQMFQFASQGFTDNIRIWFNQPCDGRFYQAIANATAMISDLEDFFVDGKLLTDWLPQPKDANISYVSRQLGGKKIILIFNHSQTESLTLNLDVPLAKGEIIWEEVTGKKIDGRTLNITLEPLDIKVYIVGKGDTGGK